MSAPFDKEEARACRTPAASVADGDVIHNIAYACRSPGGVPRQVTFRPGVNGSSQSYGGTVYFHKDVLSVDPRAPLQCRLDVPLDRGQRYFLLDGDLIADSTDTHQ